MSDTIDNNLETLRVLFEKVDQVLDDWKGKGNLQVPILLGMMAVRFNWNEKEVREYDPFVRFHIHNHSSWIVIRGAGGGIMRMSEKQKKESILMEKFLAKQQIASAIDAKIIESKSKL
jgi:hypothetical protein